MEIREAVADDLEAIVSMLADDVLGSTRESLASPLPDCYTEAFAAIDSDPNQFLAVMDSSSGIVATLQLTFIPGLSHRGGWRAQVEAVRVAASARGEGIGAKMFEWAIERAKDKGCRMVQLTSDKQRPDALRFYEGLRFKATHEGFKLVLEG